MKKIFVMLSVFLILAVPLTAFAKEDTIGKNESRNIDVQAKYTNVTETPDVYSVNIEWGAMQFTYSASGTHEWDPATHKYSDNISGSWTADGNNITVVNHSNKAVNVDFAYGAVEGYRDVTGEFSVTSDTLDAGVEDNVEAADGISTELTLSGTLPSTVTEFTKIGSVTVSLS
ncbi:MAG: hypothetical protein Q4A46_04840 [Clostridia bacterium]|nr:hypothetical protein [Clostridia bacterium]